MTRVIRGLHKKRKILTELVGFRSKAAFSPQTWNIFSTQTLNKEIQPNFILTSENQLKQTLADKQPLFQVSRR